MVTDQDSTLDRDCPVCGLPQHGSLVAGPGSEVYWHKDGSGDECASLKLKESE